MMLPSTKYGFAKLAVNNTSNRALKAFHFQVEIGDTFSIWRPEHPARIIFKPG
jgi:hypothetical protein